MKWCNACKTSKGVEDFYRRSMSPDGLAAKCKACASEYGRKRHRTSPHKWRESEFKRKFNLTMDEYQVLLAQQGEVCAICNEIDPAGKWLAVDHDHATGKVRGLLCSRCNPMLGYAQDKPDRLLQAVEYLKVYANA